MNLVSIRQALTEFLEQTDADSSILYDEIMLMRWAKKADLAIGGTYAFKRSSEKYTAEGNIISLNNSVVKVYKVLLGDHTDKSPYYIDDLSTFYATVSITDHQENYLTEYQLWSDISNGIEDSSINYFVQNGKLILPIEYSDKEVTVIGFYYDIDEDGYIMINENHIDGIVATLASKILDKSILSRKLKGRRIFNDDIAIQKDLRMLKGHRIRDARVKDMEDNKAYEGSNNDIVSILIQKKDYEF